MQHFSRSSGIGESSVQCLHRFFLRSLFSSTGSNSHSSTIGSTAISVATSFTGSTGSTDAVGVAGFSAVAVSAFDFDEKPKKFSNDHPLDSLSVGGVGSTFSSVTTSSSW